MNYASRNKKIIIILPAYNAGKTLLRTLAEIPAVYASNIILVDDASTDNTVDIARQAGLMVVQHERNRGYGANQKTCYQHALAQDADLIVMLHPDHQYDATMIPDLLEPLLEGKSDAVFGSRMLGGRPLEGGMPWWKYVANIFLTALANITFRRYLSEIHSGFRAYSSTYLQTVRYEENNDDFIFDTEIIAQGMACGLTFREVPIITRYFPEASSISFTRSMIYGFGILRVLACYALHITGIWHFKQFEPKKRVSPSPSLREKDPLQIAEDSQLKSVASPYDRKYERFSSHQVIADWLMAIKPGLTGLDVGSATGTFGKISNQLDLTLDGIEPQREWAALASPFYRRIYTTTVENIPDDKLRKYDLVIFGDVLEHLLDPHSVLIRVSTLQPDHCLFIISVPNIANIWVRINLLFGHFEYQDRGILDRTHLRFFTRRSFVTMLSEVGLKIQEIKTTPIPLPQWHAFFRTNSLGKLIYRMLYGLTVIFPRMFGYQFVVKAIKHRNK